MRKRFWMPLAVLGLGAIGFFGFGPGYLERSMNKLDGLPLRPVSAEAAALHKTLQIVDLHSDTLLWQRSLLDRADRGHEDLPRLQDGNVALQLFSSTTKSPKGQNYDANGADTDNITALTIAQLQPPRTWTSLLERSLWHGQKLDRAVGEAGGKLAKIAAPGELDALIAARGKPGGPVGAMLTVEGLHNLEG